MAFIDKLPLIVKSVRAISQKKASPMGSYFFEGGFLGGKRALTKAVVPAEESFESLFGQTGKVFQDANKDAINDATTKGGILHSFVKKAFDDVLPEDKTRLIQSLEDQSIKLSDDLTQRKAVLRVVLDKVWKEVDKAGIPGIKDLSYRQNYFPHIFEYDVLKGYSIPGTKRDLALGEMIKKYGVNRNQAETMLNQIIGKHARVRSFGPVDFHRVVDLPGYKVDESVFDVYINRSLLRAERAKRFGVFNEKVNGLATSLPEHQRQEFINLANSIIGPQVKGGLEQDSGQLMSFLRNRIVKAYMGFSFISNMFQGPYGAFIQTNAKNTLKAMASITMQKKDDMEWLKRVGAVTSELDTAFNEFLGNKEFFNKSLFNMTEHYSRAVSALAQRYYVPDLYKMLQSGSQAARQEFMNLGLNPDKVLKRGLTDYDVLKAANAAVHASQFRFDIARLPILAQGPIMRTLYTLQSFNIGWLDFVRKQAVQNGKINPTKIMKILGMGYAIGGVNNVVWSTILGKKVEAKDLMNPLTNLGYGSALGLFSDVVSKSMTGKGLSIPSLALAEDALQAGSKAIHGDIKPAIKFGARRVLLPELIQRLPMPIAIPTALVARGVMERYVRANKGDKKTR